MRISLDGYTLKDSEIFSEWVWNDKPEPLGERGFDLRDQNPILNAAHDFCDEVISHIHQDVSAAAASVVLEQIARDISVDVMLGAMKLRVSLWDFGPYADICLKSLLVDRAKDWQDCINTGDVAENTWQDCADARKGTADLLRKLADEIEAS